MSHFGFALPEDDASRDRLAELGQLASGLVHELKNPLGALNLNIQMLAKQLNADDIDRDKANRRIDRVEASSRQLGSIIESFLAFARPGKPDPDRVDINALLDHIIDEQQEFLDESQIVIHRRLSPDLNAVAADERQLRSVFLNIILNARDALLLKDHERHILIATRNRPDRVSILISNNGPALSESAAAHLFEPFFSDKDGGTGLGLAIVSRLIELHYGNIEVTSQESQGVSFTIEFPTQLGPAKPRTPLPSPSTNDHNESVHAPDLPGSDAFPSPTSHSPSTTTSPQ